MAQINLKKHPSIPELLKWGGDTCEIVVPLGTARLELTPPPCLESRVAQITTISKNQHPPPSAPKRKKFKFGAGGVRMIF